MAVGIDEARASRSCCAASITSALGALMFGRTAEILPPSTSTSACSKSPTARSSAEHAAALDQDRRVPERPHRWAAARAQSPPSRRRRSRRPRRSPRWCREIVGATPQATARTNCKRRKSWFPPECLLLMIADAIPVAGTLPATRYQAASSRGSLPTIRRASEERAVGSDLAASMVGAPWTAQRGDGPGLRRATQHRLMTLCFAPPDNRWRVASLGCAPPRWRGGEHRTCVTAAKCRRP